MPTRLFALHNVDVSRPQTLGPVQVGDADEFSFEARATQGTYDATTEWTFEVGNDGTHWATITGSTTTQTDQGLAQSVSIPPVALLRARLTTLNSSQAFADASMTLREPK